jgi:two-component system chemotaxis response regulator CheB
MTVENFAYSVLMLAEDTERFQSVRAALEKDHHYAMRAVGINTLQADEAIRAATPDLVLILSSNPPFTMKSWAERIANREIPVIFLTGKQISPTDDLMKNPRIQCFTDDGSARLQTIVLMLGVKIRLATSNSAAHHRIQQNAQASERDHMAAAVKVPVPGTRRFPKEKLIAVGASMGGVEAVSRVLEVLPAEMPGIVMVQHMPEGFTEMYAKRLDAGCRLRVVQAENNQRVEENTVYLAPGGLHMRVERDAEGYRIRIADGERVTGHKPSVNVLFSSVAKAAGKDALGVILTGMGDDGAVGLLEMRKAGAETIGQDEATALVYGMPRVAFEMGAVSRQSALMEVPKHIMNYANKK